MTERREALVSATPLELRVEQRGAELELVVAGVDAIPILGGRVVLRQEGQAVVIERETDT